MSPRSRLITLTTTLTLSLGSLGCTGLLGDPPETVISHNPPAPPRRQITLLTDGTCEEYIDVICHPEETCNPPPPQAVDCPPHVISSVSRIADGTCRAVAMFTDCPPGTDCAAGNTLPTPCPPQLAADPGIVALRKVDAYGCALDMADGSQPPVPCPPELEAPPSDAYAFAAVGDGLCRATVKSAVKCPPGMSCNPPPPKTVICPPEAGPPAEPGIVPPSP